MCVVVAGVLVFGFVLFLLLVSLVLLFGIVCLLFRCLCACVGVRGYSLFMVLTAFCVFGFVFEVMGKYRRMCGYLVRGVSTVFCVFLLFFLEGGIFI